MYRSSSSVSGVSFHATGCNLISLFRVSRVQIQDLCNVAPSDQQLSTTPPLNGNGTFLSTYDVMCLSCWRITVITVTLRT
jgi:hypothetical protein